MSDSRLVRELLAANVQLTAQVVELAKFVIGAPSVAHTTSAPMEDAPASDPASPFEMSTTDDWPDIPDTPLGEQPANVLHIHPRPRDLVGTRPLHMSEEEEDLRHSVSMGQEAPKALSDFLKRLDAPGVAVLIDPLA